MFGRKADAIRIRGTHNATLKKGEELVVHPDDEYWAAQVAAGNAVIVDVPEDEVLHVEDILEAADVDEDDEYDGEE